MYQRNKFGTYHNYRFHKLKKTFKEIRKIPNLPIENKKKLNPVSTMTPKIITKSGKRKIKRRRRKLPEIKNIKRYQRPIRMNFPVWSYKSKFDKKKFQRYIYSKKKRPKFKIRTPATKNSRFSGHKNTLLLFRRSRKRINIKKVPSILNLPSRHVKNITSKTTLFLRKKKTLTKSL